MTTYDLSGTNYSESDSANSNAAPAGMPEGMAPSGVNDAWRSGMGAVKRAYDWDHAGTWATVGGTANAVTLTYSVAPNAYVQGQKHSFKATASNTGATTININSLGAQNIFKKAATSVAACTGGEIVNGDIIEIEYDGMQFQIMSIAFNGGTLGAALNEASAPNMVAAATVDIGNIAGNFVVVTNASGATAIADLNSAYPAGARRKVFFSISGGSITLVQGAHLQCPSAINMPIGSGDMVEFTSFGTGWYVSGYMPYSIATKALMQAGTDVTARVTPALQNQHPSAVKGYGRVVTAGTSVLDPYPAGATSVKNSTGNYTITHGLTMADTNYPVILLNEGTGAVMVNLSSRTTTTFTVQCLTSAAANIDDIVNYAIFGTLA